MHWKVLGMQFSEIILAFSLADNLNNRVPAKVNIYRNSHTLFGLFPRF